MIPKMESVLRDVFCTAEALAIASRHFADGISFMPSAKRLWLGL
ncbi:MAG: hypothetical protein Q4E16_05225 [Neisseria sp.]|nr:hypothetical protein [Neisseria sp.]